MQGFEADKIGSPVSDILRLRCLKFVGMARWQLLQMLEQPHFSLHSTPLLLPALFTNCS